MRFPPTTHTCEWRRRRGCAHAYRYTRALTCLCTCTHSVVELSYRVRTIQCGSQLAGSCSRYQQPRSREARDKESLRSTGEYVSASCFNPSAVLQGLHPVQSSRRDGSTLRPVNHDVRGLVSGIPHVRAPVLHSYGTLTYVRPLRAALARGPASPGSALDRARQYGIGRRNSNACCIHPARRPHTACSSCMRTRPAAAAQSLAT